MTRISIDSTKWLPNRSISTNNRGISGIFQANDPTYTTAFITAEFLAFQRVPDKMVVPLVSSWSFIVGGRPDVELLYTSIVGTTYGGVTMWGVKPSNILIVSMTGLSGFLMTHEWGHAVDNGYQVHGGPVNGRSSQSDFSDIWARVVPLIATNGVLYYGWQNIFEFWAEAFRMHWTGSGGGTPAHDPSADGDLRNLISGPGSDVSPDDQYVTAVHAIMASLAPPGAVL